MLYNIMVYSIFYLTMITRSKARLAIGIVAFLVQIVFVGRVVVTGWIGRMSLQVTAIPMVLNIHTLMKMESGKSLFSGECLYI